MKLVSNLAVLAILSCFVPCVSFSGESDAQVRFSNASVGMLLLIKNSPENIRLEIARISPDSIFDPPVTADSFEPSAAVILTLGVAGFQNEISDSIHALTTAAWRRNSERSGLSRLRIRFLGSWGKVFGELYLDERISAISYEGIWYSIDPAVLKSFVGNLTQCAVQALTKTSGRFEFRAPNPVH